MTDESAQGKASRRQATPLRMGPPVSSSGGATTILRSGWQRTLVVAAIIVAGLVAGAVAMNAVVEAGVRATLEKQLTSQLRANIEGVRLYVAGERALTRAVADGPALVEHTAVLSKLAAEGAGRRDLLGSPAQEAIRRELRSVLREAGAVDYWITDRQGRVLAAGDDDRVGAPAPLPATAAGRIGDDSEDWFVAPFLVPSVRLGRRGQPRLLVGSNISDQQGGVVGRLHLLHDPGEGLSDVLAAARFGDSGESYAVDVHGRMLSASRFPGDLVRAGLIPSKDTPPILALQLRDPGHRLAAGEVSTGREQLPLTRMAQGLAQKADGMNLDGYRDYRGVSVVGAWRWLEPLGLGVAAEMDTAEGYEVARTLRTVFWGLFGVLALGAVAFVGALVTMARLRSSQRAAELRARDIGQYRLEKKLGEGGMGVVYRASHRMLRRPTAIKLLKSEAGDPLAVARFEREVQLTSQLTHPNTIAVYDFGRTADGEFYYAMELLAGVDLDRLIKYGRRLPPGRTIHLFEQVCGSLQEAHDRGLIHRDIKPANIIVGERGGLYDYVKVLDFGLVKRTETTSSSRLTMTEALTGTPLFLAPEVIGGGDATAASDIYAVGMSLYQAVTGRHAFGGRSVIAVLTAQVGEAPTRPSAAVPGGIPSDLEAVILRCLAKAPEERFGSVGELREALLACEDAGAWAFRRRAREWWAEHGPILLSAVSREQSAEGLRGIKVSVEGSGSVDGEAPTMSIAAIGAPLAQGGPGQTLDAADADPLGKSKTVPEAETTIGAATIDAREDRR